MPAFAAAPLAATGFPEAPLAYQRTTLANGLTLLVHEDHKAPLVAVQIWYHVGSKDEVPGKTGFAHLFEHLMFNGSQHHDDEYFRPLESAGASQINGTTSSDRTNFYETVPREALDLALWLESDRMGHLLPAVTQAKLDEQRGVVKNEKRQREGQPYGKVDEIVTQSMYPPGHPYSWTTIGSMEDLDRASVADVHNWFKTYYGPNNAVLALAGDISFAEAKAKAEQYFGSIAPGPAIARQQEWVAPLEGPKRRIAYDKVTQPRLYRVWNVPPRGHPDALLLAFAADVLAGDKASRLYKRLITRDGSATAVAADVEENELGSQFSITAVLKADADVAAVERAIDEELAALQSEPPSEAVLARLKTSVYVARLAGRESIAAKASMLAACQIFHGSPEACEAQWLVLRDATPAAIVKAAARWLTPNALTLAVLPEPAHAASTLADTDRKKLPAVGEPLGIALPPLTHFTLGNGLEVLLAERHDVPLAHLSIFWPYGTAAQPQAGEMEMLFGMLSEGAGGLNAEQLTENYGALGAAFATDLDADSVAVNLSAPVASLPAALRLFAANLQTPDFPAEALTRRKLRKQASLTASTASAPGILGLNQYRLMYGEHPYGRFNSLPKLAASTESLTPETLKTLLPRVIRPDGARILVVGDVQPAALKALLEPEFGNWQPPAAEALHSALPEVPATGPRVFLFDKPGAEQTLIAAANIGVGVADPQREAMQLANAVLGGLFTSRLNSNLREAKHWTYGASSGLGEARGPGLFYAQAQVETAHTAEAMLEARREMQEIASKRPPTAQELDQARKSLIRTLPAEAETAAGVLGLYQRQLSYALPADTYSGYPARLAALSSADVAAAARRLVKADALTWFVVGDLAQVEASVRALKLGPVSVLNADGSLLR